MARTPQLKGYTGRTSVNARFSRRSSIPDTTLINPADLDESKAIGILLPFGADSNSKTGYADGETSATGIQTGTDPVKEGSSLFRLSYLTKDQVISNVRNLILTNKGERLMNPDFGTDIYNLLFENNVPELDETIRTSVRDAFDRYMPLARIERLEVEQKEHKIHIVLGFSVKEYNINEILEITSGVA